GPAGLLRWVGRGSWAIADQGLFAGTNFLLNVMLARWLSPGEYGAFAVGLAAVFFVGTFHSALLTEPMLVFGPGKYADRAGAYVGGGAGVGGGFFGGGVGEGGGGGRGELVLRAGGGGEGGAVFRIGAVDVHSAGVAEQPGCERRDAGADEFDDADDADEFRV